MERISRSHDKFKLLKDMIKTNHYPNITVTDDLEVLKIAVNNNLKINLLFYTFDEEYKDETKELLTLSKDGNALYSLTETTLDYTGTLNNYEFIRRNLVTSVSSSLSTSIFSASSAKKVDEIEAKDIEKYYTKYIETRL